MAPHTPSGRGRVVVAWIDPGECRGEFAKCLLDLFAYDATHAGRIVRGGGWIRAQAGANLAGPRNQLVHQVLEQSDAEWLWWIDSDMTFAPDVVDRLLDHAHPEKAPIVGGLCFGLAQDGSVQPTLYGLSDEIDPETGGYTVLRFHAWPPNAMFQVAATGTGCLLVHRSVYERMRTHQLPGRDEPGFNRTFPWFQETEHAGRPVSEDITFCWRAGQMGVPVFVNTGVELGHIKTRTLDVAAYAAQTAKESAA